MLPRNAEELWVDELPVCGPIRHIVGRSSQANKQHGCCAFGVIVQHPNDKHGARAPSEARGCRPQETAEADQTSRRAVLRSGAKLAFAAPVLSTLFASQAYAANYSCYPIGHVCPGDEACCGDLACNSGVCSEFCVPANELCFLDSDCCSADCDLGICQ